MKKILFVLGLILVSFLTMGGCKVETSTGTSFGLTIEDAVFARMSADGKFVPAEGSVYKRGEKVHFILLNVDGFQKGDDGLNWFNLDMDVKGPNEEVILSQQGMLGEKGHVDLLNNTVPSPGGSLTTTAAMEPGNYKFKLTIYDKIGGGSASKTKTFILE